MIDELQADLISTIAGAVDSSLDPVFETMIFDLRERLTLAFGQLEALAEAMPGNVVQMSRNENRAR